MTTRINVFKDFRFQVRIQVPGTNGKLRNAIAGEVTGLTLRLSATENGAAINPAVDAMAATENSADPSIQYVTVNTTPLQTYLLPLGKGSFCYAIWKKAGDVDMENVKFMVWDRTSQ